jgi:hypothetical protein
VAIDKFPDGRRRKTAEPRKKILKKWADEAGKKSASMTRLNRKYRNSIMKETERASFRIKRRQHGPTGPGSSAHPTFRTNYRRCLINSISGVLAPAAGRTLTLTLRAAVPLTVSSTFQACDHIRLACSLPSELASRKSDESTLNGNSGRVKSCPPPPPPRKGDPRRSGVKPRNSRFS